jgi:hypothetical protein
MHFKCLKNILGILLLLLILAESLLCQELPDNVKVFSDNRHQLSFPWAGGMNGCQFGKIDLNLDGVKDLVVFDRTGDRLMTFLTTQSGDGYKYNYVPEYAEKFPVLSHWAIFVDYDGDGKEDIFTYSPGFAGMKVYRNTSDSELKFTLAIYPFLTSLQGGGYVNIFVTYADYPAITDLDGDGDLDILTFWGLGSFVEKHRNMSVEKYGHADSLDFVKTEFCWGYFAESEESNVLTLDTCLRCNGTGAWEHAGMEAWEHGSLEEQTWNLEPGIWNSKDRHTGSTFRILDINGDGLSDLLLGDVDYPNLVALYNGGDADTARITSYEWQYPPTDQPVDLFSMPAAYYDDFDFDGIKDLLVSPFDPNPFLISNFRSNWLYHNNGNDAQPQISLQTKSFLQDQMIDVGAGALPVFFDVDSDGLTDLLIGNFGYYDTSWYDQYLILHTDHTGQVAWLKNTGSLHNPVFTFIDRDFGGCSALDTKGLAPAFGDLDGDGDADMLLGCENGRLILYLNKANPGQVMDLDLADENYLGIDVGDFSTPQLFDLDKDNQADLLIGEKGGNLNYYRNTGSRQTGFTFITDSLGKINVTDNSVSLDGYSTPYFYRDGSGNTHLLVGSEQGIIYYYAGIDGNLAGKFTLSDTLPGLIGVQELNADRGYRSAPALYDLDQNGYPELIAGNFGGGLEYFGNSGQSPVNHIGNTIPPDDGHLKVFPSPARDYITIKFDYFRMGGSAEIYVYDDLGRIIYHESGDLNEAIRINTTSFPRGICLLKIVYAGTKHDSPRFYSCKLPML